MDQRIRELGEQLNAIARLQVIAREETDHEQHERWLAVIDRAIDAAREEHTAIIEEETRRPTLRVIRGGLASAVAGVGTAGLWLRDHKMTAVSTAAATGLVAASVVVAFDPDATPEGAQIRPPSVSAPPSGDSPAASPSWTPSPPTSSTGTMNEVPGGESTDGDGAPLGPGQPPTGLAPTTPPPSPSASSREDPEQGHPDRSAPRPTPTHSGSTEPPATGGGDDEGEGDVEPRPEQPDLDQPPSVEPEKWCLPVLGDLLPIGGICLDLAMS